MNAAPEEAVPEVLEFLGPNKGPWPRKKCYDCGREFMVFWSHAQTKFHKDAVAENLQVLREAKRRERELADQ